MPDHELHDRRKFGSQGRWLGIIRFRHGRHLGQWRQTGQYGSGGKLERNCLGNITDGGHNLSSDASCAFTAVGSMNNTDPKLGPLADNGGPTLTMALLPGSPAIDAGSAVGAPATDQRGVPRPQGAGVDIGAFEYLYSPVFTGATIQNATNCQIAIVRAAAKPDADSASFHQSPELVGRDQLHGRRERRVPVR